MKKLLFLLFVLFSFKTFSQVKEKPVTLGKTSNIDFTPKDTIRTFYLDSLSQKQTCNILLNKSKKSNQINQFKKIEIIDSFGKLMVLFPNQISGYWLKGIFYRSFKIDYNKKKVLFFAKEMETGKASLYLYDGEQLNNESIYIFKKQFETEYSFVQENISSKSEYGTSNSVPQADGSPSSPGPIAFYDEQPYLSYFQSYLSDCNNVLLKFKSNWYSYSSVRTMFIDYNNCK